MKKITSFGLVTLLGLTLASCGGEDENPSSSTITGDAAETKSEENAPAPSSTELPAISLMDNSLRVKNGEELKWSANKVVFGQAVTVTGDTFKVDKNTYIQIKTTQGKMGWASPWCYAVDCKRAVATSTVSLFKAPDIMAVSDSKLTLGDFVAVSNEEVGGYVEVTRMVGKSKKVEWAKTGNSLSFEDIDIMLAQKRRLALAEKNEDRKISKINEILDNPEWMSSPIYKDLETMMAPAQEMTEDIDDYPVSDNTEYDETEMEGEY